MKLGDKDGIHRDRLDFSFPQRFRDAFASEVAHAVLVCRGEREWPVRVQDCLAAQTIAMAASESARTGQPVNIESSSYLRPLPAQEARAKQCLESSPPVRVRAVGNGSFGSFIRSIVALPGAVPGLTLLEPYSRRSSFSFEEAVASKDNGVDAVYVCSPDQHHLPQALSCLGAGKHVLVEKPVYTQDFSELVSAVREQRKLWTKAPAAVNGPVLMVGFHRRFAEEFQRAKNFIARAAKPPRYLVVCLFCVVFCQPARQFLDSSGCVTMNFADG